MALSLSHEDRHQIAEIFKKMDHDGSGCICVKELKNALTQLDWGSDANDAARKIMGEVDANEDEMIGYAEFLSAVAYSRVEMHIGLVEETFRRFDKDNSGKIEIDELMHIL